MAARFAPVPVVVAKVAGTVNLWYERSIYKNPVQKIQKNRGSMLQFRANRKNLALNIVKKRLNPLPLLFLSAFQGDSQDCGIQPKSENLCNLTLSILR